MSAAGSSAPGLAGGGGGIRFRQGKVNQKMAQGSHGRAMNGSSESSEDDSCPGSLMASSRNCSLISSPAGVSPAGPITPVPAGLGSKWATKPRMEPSLPAKSVDWVTPP